MKVSFVRSIVFASILASCGCIRDTNSLYFEGREYPGVRDPAYEVSAIGCEGLAFSRVVTSPVMCPLAFASDFMANDHHDYLDRTFRGIFAASLEAPILMVQEIGVGLAELLTCQQFKSAYYPWEHYSISMEYEQRESRCKEKEEYRLEHPNPNLELLVEFLSAVAEGAVAGASQAASDAATKKSRKRGAVGGTSSGGGYGSITGPSSLGVGSTGVYRLYVGGKKVAANWHQNGTSITVYGSGDHARAMGGNPPIKGGKYKTGIRATYNGKTYTKTIYILK